AVVCTSPRCHSRRRPSERGARRQRLGPPVLRLLQLGARPRLVRGVLLGQALDGDVPALVCGHQLRQALDGDVRALVLRLLQLGARPRLVRGVLLRRSLPFVRRPLQQRPALVGRRPGQQRPALVHRRPRRHRHRHRDAFADGRRRVRVRRPQQRLPRALVGARDGHLRPDVHVHGLGRLLHGDPDPRVVCGQRRGRADDDRPRRVVRRADHGRSWGAVVRLGVPVVCPGGQRQRPRLVLCRLRHFVPGQPWPFFFRRFRDLLPGQLVPGQRCALRLRVFLLNPPIWGLPERKRLSRP
ncbi:hypothetical protein V8D89_000672, partial [Ganoderma adspersum]